MSTKIFYNPTRLLFGRESMNVLRGLPHDKRVLFISSKGSKKRKSFDRILESIPTDSIDFFHDINSHPDLDHLVNSVNNLNFKDIDYIFAFGGGSVIDTAKFFAYAKSLPKQANILNAITNNLKPEIASITPIVAIPTTAGTGSEVTPFATIWHSRSELKYSLSSEKLFPYMAVLDPFFTIGLPAHQTIYTALDALSHAFESIWNYNCNEITFYYSSNAIKLILNNIMACLADPENYQYRNNLLKGSLLSGLAISNTRTAIAHSISYPLTLNYGVPHGLACSFTLIELLKEAFTQPNEFISQLAAAAGFTNNEAIMSKMQQIFTELDIKRMTKEFIDVSTIHLHKNKFLNNERSSNSSINLNPNQIEKLIIKALS